MTLDTLHEIVSRHEAMTGSRDLHLLMNAYTLESIIKAALIHTILYAQPHTVHTPLILGYPVFINNQVPNDSVYTMVGSAPGVTNDS